MFDFMPLASCAIFMLTIVLSTHIRHLLEMSSYVIIFSAVILAEQVTDKLRKLPVAAQEEVLDFVEFLVEKYARRGILSEQNENLSGEQKARRIEQWAKSHSSKTPVILDDSREVIYED